MFLWRYLENVPGLHASIAFEVNLAIEGRIQKLQHTFENIYASKTWQKTL